MVEKWGIIAVNRGMWGFQSWCKTINGDILLFDTQEEAQTVADKYNEPRINNFTQYFVEKY